MPQWVGTITNPVDVVKWAIDARRIPASDYDLWVARVTGAGKDAYLTTLLGTMPVVSR